MPELVREWNLGVHELKRGIEMLQQAQERFKCFDSRGTGYYLDFFNHDDYSLDFDPKVKRLKAKAWRYLASRAEIRKVMSLSRCKELEAQLENPDSLPDITVDNVLGWLQSLDERAGVYLQEAAVEVFEWLRPRRQHYKANSTFKVGAKVILSYCVSRNYRGFGYRIVYERENQIRALDNVFHLLDGKGLSKSRNGGLYDAIDASDDGRGESEYFKFKCFRNQNLHLQFKRLDLVEKLNQFGGGGLPQSERGE
ncbi:DUF4942 domain-containing protein [Luteolibacter pohnpeiensis]|uniref:DUF4942 domain-containing protein n=1 Tax=Luteolibacter pohnpeiensis TaxID=454153 RepID=UPI0019037BB6|nr:DUF4942 domain-containing protein [Luteolibacter pohnpeiensis]